jgi:hypothetical protein
MAPTDRRRFPLRSATALGATAMAGYSLRGLFARAALAGDRLWPLAVEFVEAQSAR